MDFLASIGTYLIQKPLLTNTHIESGLTIMADHLLRLRDLETKGANQVQLEPSMTSYLILLTTSKRAYTYHSIAGVTVAMPALP